MSNPVDHRRSEVMHIVKRFEVRLRLARATELVSCNRLLEAESLLSPRGVLPMSVDELDLLARIHVKQHRFAFARLCWEGALKSGERPTEFQECLKVLEDFDKRLFGRRMLIWKIKLGLCFITLFLSIWMLISVNNAAK